MIGHLLKARFTSWRRAARFAEDRGYLRFLLHAVSLAVQMQGIIIAAPHIPGWSLPTPEESSTGPEHFSVYRVQAYYISHSLQRNFSTNKF